MRNKLTSTIYCIIVLQFLVISASWASDSASWASESASWASESASWASDSASWASDSASWTQKSASWAKESNARSSTQSIYDYMDPNSAQYIAVMEARKAGIESRLVLAILRHESANCTLQQAPKRVRGPNGKVGLVRHDLGCMQVNRKVAAKLGLDLNRLETDKRYNIWAGVSILKAFKARYAAKEPGTWHCRYNVGTGLLQGQVADNCLKYLNRLSRDSKGFKMAGM